MTRRSEEKDAGFVLVCAECAESSEQARGWKAYLAEPTEVVVYCEDCAEREFGGRERGA